MSLPGHPKDPDGNAQRETKPLSGWRGQPSRPVLRARLFVVMLLLMMIFGLALWWWPATTPGVGAARSEREAPPKLAAAPAAASSASASAAVAGAAAPAAMLAATPETLASQAVRAEKQGVPAALADQTSLELCGIGNVPMPRRISGREPESFELLPGPLGQWARAEAWPRVLAAMQASPLERARAAALVLQASGLLDAAASPAALSARPDTVPFVRQLALMAQGTRDAGVLQWALAVCAHEPGLAECQALSAADLVAMAPEDGRSWLLLAAADPARREEALRRVAQAPVLRGTPTLASAMSPPPGLPPYLWLEMLGQVHGVEAAFMDTSMFAALRYCRAAGDDGRAVCLALADALALRGSDLMSLSVARSLGQSLGWPAARLAELKLTEEQLVAQVLLVEDTTQPYSCANVERVLSWVTDWGLLGEREALQRRVAAAQAVSAASAASAAAKR